jgi:hypothetical protein
MVGLRGVGKTVLLDRMRKDAEEEGMQALLRSTREGGDGELVPGPGHRDPRPRESWQPGRDRGSSGDFTLRAGSRKGNGGRCDPEPVTSLRTCQGGSPTPTSIGYRSTGEHLSG